jgi:hypothetical protein
MFKACPRCNGWGISRDDAGFQPIKCPQCDGLRIVDRVTERPRRKEKEDEETTFTCIDDFDF